MAAGVLLANLAQIKRVCPWVIYLNILVIQKVRNTITSRWIHIYLKQSNLRLKLIRKKFMDIRYTKYKLLYFFSSVSSNAFISLYFCLLTYIHLSNFAKSFYIYVRTLKLLLRGPKFYNFNNNRKIV